MTRREKILVAISLSLDLLGAWGVVSSQVSGSQKLIGLSYVFWGVLLIGSVMTVRQIYKAIKFVGRSMESMDNYFRRYYTETADEIKRAIDKTPTIENMNSVFSFKILPPRKHTWEWQAFLECLPFQAMLT